MSSCSCIKGIYRPVIEGLSRDSALYTDVSKWMDIDAVGTYPVTITNETLNHTVTLNIPKHENFILTPEILGLSGDCLADDIYCLTAKTCGEEFTVYRFFDGNTREIINELLAKGDERYKILKDINERIKVSVENKDIDTAKSLFRLLLDLTKNIDCDAC